MKIYDCITFFNELDLLEMRMEMLNDVVDFFVINEATVTFQNNPKALYYLENKERFKKFEHKIIHNIIEDTPKTNDHWDNDSYHKNCVKRALTNCFDDDIIMYSDADEIANSEVVSDIIKNIYEPDKLYVFVGDWYSYYLDAKINDIWYGTRMCSYSLFKKITIDDFRQTKSNFCIMNHHNIVEIRNNTFNKTVGWHYTWLGGVDNVILKLESFSHAEYNNDAMKSTLYDKITNLRDIIGRNTFDPRRIKLTEQNTHKYLLNNLNKYRHLLCYEQNLI